MVVSTHLLLGGNTSNQQALRVSYSIHRCSDQDYYPWRIALYSTVVVHCASHFLWVCNLRDLGAPGTLPVTLMLDLPHDRPPFPPSSGSSLLPYGSLSLGFLASLSHHLYITSISSTIHPSKLLEPHRTTCAGRTYAAMEIPKFRWYHTISWSPWFNKNKAS